MLACLLNLILIFGTMALFFFLRLYITQIFGDWGGLGVLQLNK